MAEGYKEQEVQLGFVEEVPSEESHLLFPEYFPSKVGGKPSWIGGPLLSSDEAACPVCFKRMPLLLQIYAPLNNINDQAFHRMIFILSCKNPTCHKSSSPFRVLRAQLPQENDFIIDNEDDQDHEPSPTLFSYLEATCEICGWKATKHCAKCKQLRYCEREHQIFDWTNGHNKECSQIIENANGVLEKLILPEKPDSPIDCKRISYRPIQRERRFRNQMLFKEFEIVTETEDRNITDRIEKLQFRADMESGRLLGVGNVADEDEEEGEDEDIIKERTDAQMQILHEYKKKLNEIHGDGFDEEDWAEKSAVDATFLLFQEIIAPSPDQILRYSFGNRPLWVHSKGKPLTIPPCSCGAERVFEFQILPQLLYYLSVEKTTAEDSIDWGTLLIYSCQKSCNMANGETVKEEFLWKQHVDRM